MFYESIQQFAFALNTFHGVLAKAEASTANQDALLSARLAPDMFAFTRQVQIATDVAKFAAARLTGATAPAFEDNEVTFADLHARLQKAIDYLQTFSADAFAGAAERRIVLPYNPSASLSAADYLQQYVIPNFYFHLATAYGILRSQGVEIGKRDFLGDLRFQA